MQAVDEKIETIHLYVVREQEKKPYTFLPLLCAFFCLLAIAAVTLYSAEHPYYEHKILTVPAQLLPLQTFTATTPVIPTGVKTYPATTASGTLTITNGSVIAQVIPAGFTVQNVTTDRAVYVPAGSANGYGYATVQAHALMSGIAGNLAPLAINQVVGSSVYIRNLDTFYGGRDAYAVKFVTAQDIQTALSQARGILLSKSSGLHYPCIERFSQKRNLLASLTWRCQFVRYTVPSYMHVAAVRLSGWNVLVDVWFVPRPTHIWVK